MTDPVIVDALSDETVSADQLFDALETLMRRSEYLQAFDLAQKGVAAYPGHVGMRHRGVLALARMGAAERARDLYAAWGMREIDGDEDVLALWARLKKDQARTLTGAARAEAYAEAARAYALSFDYGGGGHYPAVNVATMKLLAGDSDGVADWARKAAGLSEGHDDYYGMASLAEAALLVDSPDLAAQVLARLPDAAAGDWAALSTTRQQLAEVIAAKGQDPSLLDPLAAPPVAHFCGHMVGHRMPADELPRIAQEIEQVLDRTGIGFAVGSLAGGADIMIAEAVLARGGELTLVLPFAREEFVNVSVAPSGPDWVVRFDACMDAAHRVHFVTEDAHLGDDSLFTYASHFALGLARLRAGMLGTQLRQLGVWDGAEPTPNSPAGTVYDLAKGNRMGLEQDLIASRPDAGMNIDAMAHMSPPDVGARRCRTMVFGDLKGFSKLSDGELPVYVQAVLGTVAKVLAEHEAHLKFRNTWGDGIFLVLDDVAAAAACAFALGDAIAALDRQALGLPDTLGLRLGLHYGPVFETVDPVLDRPNYFGFHVSRAARVEPITPEGEVYVTEQAAAALAVDAADTFRCDYVGRVPLAKGYGDFPMYALTRLG
ncbi:MAG: tetratricopeptide repeat-containing protein [Pseudomonadota bacterium]